MPRCGAPAFLFLAFLSLAFLPFVVSAHPAESLPLVQANENRTPAGELHDGVLDLHLELREARWNPSEENGVYHDVYAFAEHGFAPQISGPLIRVPQGTQIHASLRNMLTVPAQIYGLHARPGDANASITLAPNEAREIEFLAGQPGTYFYWGSTSEKPLDQREGPEALLAGAFIVDAPGAHLNDRVFVISILNKAFPGAPGFSEVLSINGKSWPHTERLNYKIGDSAHWRIINTTYSDHGMHLHGFYFTVDGEGDGEHFETHEPARRLLAVTQHIDPGHVFEMTWTPDRPGNWLFHCHMAAHIAPEKSATPTVPSTAEKITPPHDHFAAMAGLVLGITVSGEASANRSASTPPAAAHKLQLLISDNPAKVPLYDLEVHDPRIPAAADKKPHTSLLGPPIVLSSGEAAEIEVKNASANPTAVHWHGIELESYYDGVPGWTGSGSQLTPPIAPGESFVARMTPPRAGTFIYHTHWHDDLQLINGLYGPLIVLAPGEKYDPERDRVFVFSVGKYAPFGFILLINGHPQPDPIALQSGTRYRLRFINITDDAADLRVRLSARDALLHWKLIAKDGADLPEALRRSVTADMGITVGETLDVEYQAATPGLAELRIWEPSFPSSVTLPLNFAAPK